MPWICEADLADILGRDRALQLTSTLGGLRIYVPARAHAAHRIARAIGVRGMDLLCAARAGETLELPNTRQKDTARRRAAQLLRQGAPHAQIAHDCNVTQRYVEAIAQELRQADATPQQLTLI